jgi:molybdopterin-containing oxidoreductase family membrane subunit
VALVPFFIVGFEFTILFSVFGNVIGLINIGGLPDWEGLAEYDPRCSGDHYGITAACAPDQASDLRRFFQERGARISELDSVSQPA